MEPGSDDRTYRQYPVCMSGADAYREFDAESTHGPHYADYGVGMGALLIELLRAVFCPKG